MAKEIDPTLAASIEATLQAGIDAAAGETPAQEEAAPELDSAQAASTEQPSEEGEQPAKEDSKPGASAGLDPVQKLIDSKYKGDKQEFIKGLYEQWNSTSRMARKIEELEERLAQGTTPQPTPDSDKDIQWLTPRVQAIDFQLQTNVNRQNAIITEIDQLRVDSARLEGRIAATDDENAKDRFERQLDSLKNKIEGQRNEFFRLKNENFNLDREKYAASRMLEEKQKLYEKRSHQEQTSTGPDPKWQEAQNTDFETTVFGVALAGGMTPDTDDFNDFMETVRAKVLYEHQKNADAPALTKTEAEKLYESIASKELKKYKTTEFKKFTEEKVEASGTRLPVANKYKGTAPAASSSRTAPSIPTGKLTPAQARAHAARILGG